jgi:hypothetical protein
MGIQYQPLTESFRELNRMLIEKQQWDADFKLREADRGLNNMMKQSQLESMQQQQKMNAYKLKEAAYENEEIGITSDDLINPQNPAMNQWFQDNQQDIARQFTNDPNAYFDEDTKQLTVLDPNGAPTPFVQSRGRFRPHLLSFMYRIGAEIDPVEAESTVLNQMIAERDGLKKQMEAANADYFTRQPAFRATLKAKEQNLNTAIGNLNLMRKDKNHFRHLYDEQRKFLAQALAEVINTGADPVQAERAYRAALDRIAINEANLEKKDGATALERGWSDYNDLLIAQGKTPITIATYKNEVWDPINPERASDFKLAYNDWATGKKDADGTVIREPFVDPVTGQKVEKKFQNRAYFKTRIWERGRDVTPQGAMNALENLWYSLPDPIQDKLNTAGYTFADASKAVSDRMTVSPGKTREELLYEIYGEIRSGNFESLRRAAKGLPPVAKTAPAQTQPTAKQALDVSKRFAAAEKANNPAFFNADGSKKTRVFHKPTGQYYVKKNGRWMPESGVKKSNNSKTVQPTRKDFDTQSQPFNNMWKDTVGE